MATDTQRLIVSLEAQVTKFEKALAKANGTASKQTRAIEKKFVAANTNISNSLRSVGASLSIIEGPLGGVAGRISSIASVAGSTGIALGVFGAGMAATGFAAYKALGAFQAFETQQLVLGQVLRATGGASGKTAGQIEDLAQSIASATLASTSEVRDAAAQLLTFRSVSGETFDRTLRLAQDLATVGFGTVKTSAVQLGKALEDPIKGLSALRRVGVSFSDAQKQVIQDLVNTGRTAEAQEKILDALASQVGGAGGASSQGLAGAYDSLSQATDNLLVRWGSQIAAATNLRAGILSIASAIDEVNARAGLGAQLVDVNRQISIARAEPAVPAMPGGMDAISRAAAEVQEGKLAALLKKRHELQRQIFEEGQRQSMTSYRGMQAQETIRKEQAEGVLSSLEKERDLAGKTAQERRIITELASAGVTAESELGKQIVANVMAIDAATEALKKRNKAGKEDQFDRATGSVEDSIRQLAAETQALANINPLVEDYGRALAYATTRQKLLAAAQDAGLSLTPELIAQVNALSEAYAGAAERSNQLKDEQDRIRDAAQDAADSQREFLGGVITDLKRGISFADALANAFGRLADKALETGLDSLFSGGGLFGGKAGGRGGGLLGGAIIPGILHGGGVAGKDGYSHGRSVSPSVFSGAPRYHGGGVAGLKPGEVPAILKKGEPVLPSMEALRNIAGRGGSSGAVYAPVYNIDARNSTPGVADQIAAAIEAYDSVRAPVTARQSVSMANRNSTSPAFRK
jgi:hypothetical protein